MIDKKLYFRPAVVLFVRKTGEKVKEQLNGLLELAAFNEQLHAGIGLLQVEIDAATTEARATPYRPSPKYSPPFDQEGMLEDLVEAMVMHVQGYEVNDAIDWIGYDASAPVYIYIIGNAQDPWLGLVLKKVRQHLRQALALEPTICYLLDCSPPSGMLPSPQLSSPPIDWAQREIANFTFLYDDKINFPNIVFVTNAVLQHYMIAETLFAFIATSISVDATLDGIIQQQPGDTYNKQGSLKTSLVYFPRASVERYCSADLGAEMMNGWLASLQRARPPREEIESERSQAKSEVEAIKRWFNDSVLRPNADPDRQWENGLDPDEARQARDPDLHLWPTLDILSRESPYLSDYDLQDQLQRLNQLTEETRRLFELFLHEEADQMYVQYQYAPGNWTDVANTRVGRAPDRYVTWEMRAEAAWSSIAGRVVEQVRQTIDQKWQKGESGVALSKIYVEKYYDELTKMSDTMVALREQHAQKYQAGIEKYRLKAANWLNQGSMIGQPTGTLASPQAAGASPNPGGTVGGGSGGTPPPPLPQNQLRDQYLTPEEDIIAKSLLERIKVYEARIPTRSSLLTSIALSLTGGGIPLLTFLPGLPLTYLLGMAAIFAGGGWAAHGVLRHRRTKEMREAESDFLKFYCLCYANRCERFEDLQREMLLGPLRQRVFMMLLWLEDREGAIARVRDLLKQKAQEEQKALFESASNLFDFFIVSGSQLSRPTSGGKGQKDQITLAEVTEMIKDYCTRNGELDQEWQNDPRTIREEYFASLRKGKRSFEMTDEETRDNIIEFMTQRIINGYLTNNIVDPHYALQEDELQKRILQRMQRPLLQLLGRMQALRSFANGWKPLDGMQLNDITFRSTDEREWYLFASLFFGNTRFPLDIDALMPIR